MRTEATQTLQDLTWVREASIAFFEHVSQEPHQTPCLAELVDAHGSGAVRIQRTEEALQLALREGLEGAATGGSIMEHD